MNLNSADYTLIIIGKYPTSFLAHGQVNFGEWIIANDDSLRDFLSAPNDFIDQIKLNVLEVYVRTERTSRRRRSPIPSDVHPQVENHNSVDAVPVTQSSYFPHITQYQNLLTGRYDFDLNEGINENDR